MRRLARHSQARESWARLPFVGFVDSSGRTRHLVVHPGSRPVPALGKIERLPELVARAGATDVIVAVNGTKARKVRGQLEKLKVRVHWLDDASAAGPLELASPSDASLRQVGLQGGLKRLLDMVGAGLGLFCLLPLLLTVAVAILLTTGRPIFYTQERIGQRGRRFRIWKFRSMRTDAENATGPVWAEDHDRRCTKIGDWLRHTNIDELPQLWNVFVGDMSLVGPRPERPCFVDQFKREHCDYDLRHAVPVGLTGWAQVHGWRGKTSLRKRIQYDLDYIDRWSFWLDLRVLAMTVEHVLFGKTSWTPRKPRG